MDSIGYILGLVIGAATGVAIMLWVLKRLRNPVQSAKTERPPLTFFTVLKLAALVPAAFFLSLLLTSLETAFMVVAGCIAAGSDMQNFQFEDHAWVKQFGIPFLLFCWAAIIYFGAQRVLGLGTLRVKGYRALGLGLLLFGTPVAGAFALDSSNFQPAKAAAPLDISAFGFEMTPAAGWQVERNDEAPAGESPLIITAPLQDDYAASLNLIVTPLPSQSKILLKEVRTEIIRRYRESFSRFTLLHQDKTQLDGIPALSLSATHQTLSPGVTSPRPLRMHQVVAVHDDRLFVFTCTALDSNYADYQSQFAAMLDSVHWQ